MVSIRALLGRPQDDSADSHRSRRANAHCAAAAAASHALPPDRPRGAARTGNADSDVFFSSVAVLDTRTWAWSTPRLQARPLAGPPQDGRSACGHSPRSKGA